MRTLLISSLIIVFLAATSCSEKSAAIYEPDPGARVLRIAVATDGTVALDGIEISPSALHDALAAEAETDAVVWYYRENPEDPAPAEASMVIQAVIENGLPISFSTEPDFSTVVSEDGTVRAR